MTKTSKVQVRRSIWDIQNDYDAGKKTELENLMKAWHGIQNLPPDDPNSFFIIGGFHGEPFRGAGWGNSQWWGGYCNHGNVLFPTWHRAYLVRLENALQSIKGCENVTQPFLDECGPELQPGGKGLPPCLTQKSFTFSDGKTIDNPLRSFKFPKTINDNISGDAPNYSKPQGDETVRYPLSGLYGTKADTESTEKHNSQYPNDAKNIQLLNENLQNWLSKGVFQTDPTKPTHTPGDWSAPGVAEQYTDCLDAPNYTLFSNTTSAQEHNGAIFQDKGTKPVTPLEEPHNNIHLSIGGYDYPTGPNAGDFSPITGANGDMGENDTAGLDPIFFFHHCFVDYTFWIWQNRQGATKKFDIIAEYPGTNSVDSQGPTPGTAGGTWLTMDTPLNPFVKAGNKPVTSKDVIDVEKQLNYTYGAGSLDKYKTPPQAKKQLQAANNTKVLQISKINRAPISGSFLVSAFANAGGKKVHLGTKGILSRWHVQYCANCQNHLEVKAHFEVPKQLSEKELQESDIEVVIRGRKETLSDAKSEYVKTMAAAGHQPYKVQLSN